MTDDVARIPVVSQSEGKAEGAAQKITVVVSYVRGDQALVRQLATALAEVGVTAEGDWDLPPGVPFREALSLRIAAASCLVLMLSPEFLASREVALELECARRLGTRLAPILLRPVPPGEIPKDIQAINWITWPGDGDLRRVAELVREGIDKDFTWEREHSWLAGRQASWALANRKRSYTLRRDDLRQAESWIARAGANPQLTPRPTQDLIDFVAQSRRDERRAQRQLFGTIIAILLVVLGLGAYALQQANARAASDRGRALALAGQAQALAGQARADRDRATEADLKLTAERGKRAAEQAAEAQKLEAERQKTAALVNAENAQREQLRRTEEMGRQLLNEGKATDAAPYLSHVYSGRAGNPRLGGNDALRFMMARAAAPLEGRRLLLSDDATGVNFVAFSQDDSRIATTDDNGDLWIWEAGSGAAICGRGPDDKSAMIGAAFAPDGKRVFAYESHYDESDDPEVTGTYEIHVSFMDCPGAFSVDYEAMYGEDDPDDVTFDPPRFTADGRAFSFGFDLKSGDELFSLTDGEPVEAPVPAVAPAPEAEAAGAGTKRPCTGTTKEKIWTSADGSLLVDATGTIHRTADCAWLGRLEGSTPIRAAAFSHDNRLIAAGYGDGAVIWEWSRSRSSLLGQWDTGGRDAVFADASGSRIVVAKEAATVSLDVASGRRTATAPLAAGESVTLFPLTERMLVESETTAELRDSTTGKALAKLELGEDHVQNNSHGTLPDQWRVDPATKRLMIKYPRQWDVVSQTVFELRDLQSGEQLSEVRTLGDDFDALAMNWETEELFTASRNGINASLWTNTLFHWNPRYIREEETFGRVSVAAFLPDAETVLTAVSDGTARFYDSPVSRPRIRTRITDAKEIAVSRDGRFALIGNGRSTEILDLANHRSVALCAGRTSGDRWAISADSRLAVTTGPYAMVRVWHLESGRLLTTMDLPAEPTAPARFNEAGTEILVQAGRFTQVWDARPESRPPDAIARQVARLLPVRLEGERLVARE